MSDLPGPAFPALPPGQSILPQESEVVLLCAPLDVPQVELARLRATFAPREEARAQRFVPQYRDRWVAARGHLRGILARATGGNPAALRFAYGAHGKPALDPASAPPLAGPPVTFNVSHSGALGLYALSRGREVGVDIEQIRERRTDQVAARFFHPRESAALRALADEEARRAAFFGVWCGKEAFIKATGAGLSQSMSSFELVLGPGGPEAVGWHRHDAGAAARWSVHLIAPSPGYAAALIAERRDADPRARPLLRQYWWSGS
jgi:4'-phosphopantetheinyl transferase